MTDYTSEISRLQRARIEMQSAKKLAEIEVKEKYAVKIRDEIKRRTAEAELEFAHELADAHARGVPQSLIRSEVLRTNVWSRWTYWRDLAEIEPDRVISVNRREQSRLESAVFRISEDRAVLTVTQFRGGVVLDTPVEYDLSTLRKINGRWWPDAFREEDERAAMSVAGGGGPWTKWLDEGISAEISAGRLEEP